MPDNAEYVAKEISSSLSRTGAPGTHRSMRHFVSIQGGTVYPAIKRLTRSSNYVAVCTCKWMSKAQDTREAAEREGATHIDGPGPCPKCGARCDTEVCECPPVCLSAKHAELLHNDGCNCLPNGPAHAPTCPARIDGGDDALCS